MQKKWIGQARKTLREFPTNRKFPYLEVAMLWNEGRTLSEIAKAIGRLDDSKDKTHTLRAFITKMHKGYVDADGRVVRLPYRRRANQPDFPHEAAGEMSIE